MIEAATSAIFLWSSLLGAGTANAQAATVVNSTPVTPIEIASTTEIRTLTDAKLIEEIVRKEYADKPILVEIARCESRFRQYDTNGTVIRGKVDPRDIGVMQINEYYNGDTAKKLGFDIYSIDGNLEFAAYLYAKRGTSPWQASAKCWAGGDIAQR